MKKTYSGFLNFKNDESLYRVIMWKITLHVKRAIGILENNVNGNK